MRTFRIVTSLSDAGNWGNPASQHWFFCHPGSDYGHRGLDSGPGCL